MTVTEYAAAVGVHRQTVLHWVTVGAFGLGPLPATRSPEGAVNRWGHRYVIDAARAAKWYAKYTARKAAREANEQARARRALGL